jgi:hypothetical protein
VISIFSLLIFCAHADVWIWPGAYRTQSANVADQSVLVLQRNFDREGHASARGPSPWPWPVNDLTVVFRLQSRPNPEQITKEFLSLKKAWQSHGVHVEGLQLDYDSPTAKLANYRGDLQEILKRLPADSKLSVTGLADWLKLRQFDFDRRITVYFQLYRGAREHALSEMNLHELARARYPFKLGLLPNQNLPATLAASIQKNSRFEGYTKFYGGTQL